MPWSAGDGSPAGPSLPLLISGAVLTVAGAFMYFVPRLQSPLFGIGALALAFTAAGAACARARR
ncbi:hypothetical protein [Streptomyces sp. NPDC048266]|uniref:hypothetical protein n=1 Tax=Streptomyces sp. NPDC048266 TaxID=3155787 RepID=UPI0033EF3336